MYCLSLHACDAAASKIFVVPVDVVGQRFQVIHGLQPSKVKTLPVLET